MVIRRSDQVCQSAPSPARARRAKRECVCARARLSVCVCARACVCVERGGSPIFPRFEHAPAPGWAMGRRRQSPLGFILSPARPGQFRPRGGHLEPGADSRPSQPTNGRPRAPEPGAPSFRHDPADGRAWHSGEGLQVGKGVISICFFYGVLRLPRGVDAYSLESCSPRNPLCPCLFHRTVSQPEAQAIRGGGAPPSVSLSPSKWGKGRPQANRRTQTRRSLPFTKGLVEGAARGAELLQGIREASRIGQPHRAPGRETLLGPELVGGAWEGREELTVRLSRLPQDIHTHIRRNRAHPPRPNWTDVLPLEGSLRGKFLPQMYTFF